MNLRYRVELDPKGDGYRIVDTERRRTLDTAATHAEAEDALQAWLDENVCADANCDEPLDDGEGFDGYCGNHADILESQGHWD